MEYNGITITAEGDGLKLSKSVYPIQTSVLHEQINTCKNSLMNEFTKRGISKEKVKIYIK